MKPALTKFLAELYDIDPSLQMHESEILPLVEELLRSDPSQAPDEHFVQSLRAQLQSRAMELGVSSTQSVWTRVLFALGGGAITAAVILPLTWNAWHAPGMQNGKDLFSYDVRDSGAQAFGSLRGIAEGTTPEQARSQSGGGGGGMGGTMMIAPAVPPDAEGAPMMDSKMMIAPYPMTRYEYEIDGEIKDLAASVPVFKKDASRTPVSFSAFSSFLDLGDIDLDSFGHMNLDSAAFSQSTPFGHQLSLNLRDGMVYLDANWEQWPQSKCLTDACYQEQRVKLHEIPADDVLINIARKFADEHSIDLSHYGTPEVDKQWKVEYDRAESPEFAYIPDTMRVVFPLQIDGTDVYDLSGAKTGIAIGVHLKERRVINVYGIMDRTYLKSDYAGVTKEEDIKAYLLLLDNYPMPLDTMRAGAKPDIQTNTVVLGTPTVGYVMYYRFDTTVTEELLVPSLLFPVKQVKGMDSASYYRNTVVVPLAEEMLKSQDHPQIMPMMEGGDVRAM